jgi:hypothetical protein
MVRMSLLAASAFFLCGSAFAAEPGMTIDFVGDWCSPQQEKGSSIYTLPSWTEDRHCTNILSVHKDGFYFSDEKTYCDVVKIRLGHARGWSDTIYTATIKASCAPDGPTVPGKIRNFSFSRYKGHLTVTPK